MYIMWSTMHHSQLNYRVYSNRTQAKITILMFVRFSGKGRHTLHYDTLITSRVPIHKKEFGLAMR